MEALHARRANGDDGLKQMEAQNSNQRRIGEWRGEGDREGERGRRGEGEEEMCVIVVFGLQFLPDPLSATRN